MEDYIKRSDVLALQTELRFDDIDRLQRYKCRHIDPLEVKLLPAADVVPVVRCRDCSRYETELKLCMSLSGPNGGFCCMPDFFCAYGQRRA